MEGSRKLKTELPYDPEIFTSVYLHKDNKNTKLKIYMHTHVYSSIVYNSQDTEAT